MKLQPAGFADEGDAGHEGKRDFTDDRNRGEELKEGRRGGREGITWKEQPGGGWRNQELSLGCFKFQMSKRHSNGDAEQGIRYSNRRSREKPSRDRNGVPTICKIMEIYEFIKRPDPGSS